MLHIILLILKIIGIILLCILSILLLTVCCALFVPLRYRIEVVREEGGTPFTVRAKVTWLLHLVNVLIVYPADVYVRVRIFLFTLLRIPETEKKHTEETSRKKKKQKEKKSAGEHENTAGEEKPQEITEPSGQAVNGAASDADTKSDAAGTGNRGETPDAEPSGFPGKLFYKIRRSVRALLCKIKGFLEKLKAAIQNILYTIRHMCDKIKSTSDTIQYYKEVLESDAFRHSWELCKGQTGNLLKALKPDKFEADLIVGTGDPASTGEILAVYGMLYPFLGKHVRIVGDFERVHVEGYLFVKGRIRAFTFLRVAWKVYRNKDIRTLIKLFKKEAV